MLRKVFIFEPPKIVDNDFNFNQGLVKLWHFGKNTVEETVEKIAELPSAVRDYLPFFKKYHLEYIYCTGVDYVNQSMNFYFAYFDESIEHAQNLLKDLGFDTPNEVRTPQTLAETPFANM